jgi:hypothetical protein
MAGARGILTVDGISPFQRSEISRVVGLGQPVVFRGLCRHLPASRYWTLEYLSAKVGSKEVLVRSGLDDSESEPAFRKMSFQTYVDQVRRPFSELERGRLYLSDWPIAIECPELVPDIKDIGWFENWLDYLPRPIKNTWPYVFMQVGWPGAHYPPHTDYGGLDAWACQFYGRKRWRLHSPSRDFDAASVEITESDGWHEVEVGEGDVVFVPSGWIHEVDSMSVTISIVHNQLCGRNFVAFAKAMRDRDERRVLWNLVGLGTKQYYF